MNLKELKSIRKSKNISLIDLSKQTGLSRITLWRIENGKVDPHFNNIESIAKALNLELRFVL